MADLVDIDNTAPADSLYEGAVKINLIRTRLDGLYTILSDITAAEANQVANLGSTTITAAQWVYLGELDQNLTKSSNVQFAQLNIADKYTFPTVDGSANQVIETDGSGVLSWTAQTGGANTALSNLASVAINTSLISDKDDTDDLGSDAIQWRNLYIDGIANIDSLVADTAAISAGTISGVALTDITMSLGSDVDLDIYYRSSNKLTRLGKGAANKVLAMNADASALEWATGGGGYTNLTSFVNQTAWRAFYSNAAGDVTELALGTSGQYLKSAGATSAPGWDTPGGAGDVVGPASATNNAIARFDTTTGKLIQNSGITITDADVLTLSGDIDMSAGASTIVIRDNTCYGLRISEGANEYLAFQTTNGAEKILLFEKLEAGAAEIEGSNFDINGGVIDGTVIGNGSPAEGSFTCLSLRSAGEARFYDDGNYVGFKAPALDDNQIWVLPSADGAANQVIKTDGGGNLSWVSAPGADTALSNLASVAINASLVPGTDDNVDLGSAAKEWKNLYVDGIATIDSLVADTADINGGTVDGITSLTAAGDLDIGAHGFRAASLTADGLAEGKAVITSTAGLLATRTIGIADDNIIEIDDADAADDDYAKFTAAGLEGRSYSEVRSDLSIPGRRLENLCRNAAFASRSGGTSAVPDEWTLEGTPTVAYDTVNAGYGDHAVKLTASVVGDEGINQTLTHLKASTNYQVFARVKVDAGDTASLITTGATTNINADSTSATWENISGEFTTDASGTDVVIKLVASADTDVAYFCGITCVEGDVNPLNFIRRVNEIIYLTTQMTDTSWDGDAKSTADSTTLDLSAFGNGCPPKIRAVLISVLFKDSGSSGTTIVCMLGPNITNAGAGGAQFGKYPDSAYMGGPAAMVPCDANGDVYVNLVSSGEGTLDVWLYIYGYILGE